MSSEGFTLTSQNGTIWVTKCNANKSFTMLYCEKDDNKYYPIGLVRDIETFKKFFEFAKEK